MKIQIKFLTLCLLGFCVLFLQHRAMAQGITTGSITGSVVDPQGAVISGAIVNATDPSTGISRSTVSEGNGVFAFRGLPIGKYDVHITAPGFQTVNINAVPVASGVTSDLKEKKLSISSSAAEVEVVASGTVELDTTQSQITSTFTTEQLQDVPLGNGFDEVATLVPGVVRTQMANFSNSNGPGFSVNGLRGRSNNFELDGQSNNDNSVTGPQVFFGNQDAIQEVQVITNNFSAQYGRNMGSIVNYITKSGTNSFHGSGFEFYTGSWLQSFSNQEKTALDGFCAPGQTPAVDGCITPVLPRQNSNAYGGTIGGPILKNKLWFFGSTYWQKVFTGVIPSSSGGLVTPTPAGLQQLASDFPGDPAVAVLSKYGPFGVTAGNPIVIPGTTTMESVTLPNGNTTLVPVAQFQRSVATPFNDQEDLGRVDWQPTQKDHIFVRYFYQTTLDVGVPASSTAAGYWSNVPSSAHSIGGDLTHTFSARLVDQVRYSFQQTKVAFDGGANPNCLINTLSECASNISFIGGTTDASFGLAANFPSGRTVKVTQVQDNATATKGNHTFLFGGEFDYQNSPNVFLPNYNGVFQYNNLSNFLNDSNGNGQVLLANGNPVIPFNEKDYALYFQDTWKARKNLTLNLGLRWEYFGQAVNLLHDLSVKQQTGSDPFWNTQLPLADTTVPKVNSQWKNYEPRVGFSWNPDAFRGRTVVRGGYALNFDPAFYNIFLNAYDAAPVINTNIFSCGGPCLPATGAFSGADVRNADLQFLPNGGDPRFANQSYVPQNFRNPYAQTYYVGIQYQLTPNALLNVQYVGTHGAENFQAVNANPYLLPVAQAFPNIVAPSSLCQTVANPGYGRPNCNLANDNLVNNGAFLIYNGLQASITTRNLHGLTATFAYTYSRAIDNASEIFPTGGAGVANEFAQNPLNPNYGERGNSADSYPNSAAISFTYAVPFYAHQNNWKGKLLGGFSINGYWNYLSGQVYNPLQPLTLPSGDTSFCDGVFNASFSGNDTCRMIVSNPRAPLNTVAYLTTDPANPNAPAAYYEYGTTGGQTTSGTPIPGTPINPANARWIVDNQLEAQALGNPYPGSGRNILRGQPYDDVDASVFKTTHLSERLSLQLQLNAYNALNHNYLGTPNINLSGYNSSLAVNPFLTNKYNATGLPNLSNISGNRLIQLGGKIIF